jgi:anti-anti-sigma factor
MVIQNNRVRLQADHIKGVLVISVAGQVHGTNAREFHDNLHKEIIAPGNLVVLDLEKLSYINSAGLRSILIVAKTLQGRNVRFVLCSLSDSVKEIFKIGGFDKIIEVFESRSDAIAAITA